MRKSLNRKLLVKKCDVLFSKIVRFSGVCVKCGTKGQMQCAHVISRTYHQTRWDKQNAMCLCPGCHSWWHKEPFEAVRWFEGIRPGRYDELNKRRIVVQKVDLENVYEILNSEKNMLGL